MIEGLLWTFGRVLDHEFEYETGLLNTVAVSPCYSLQEGVNDDSQRMRLFILVDPTKAD